MDLIKERDNQEKRLELESLILGWIIGTIELEGKKYVTYYCREGKTESRCLEHYQDEMDAREGHVKWCDRAENKKNFPPGFEIRIKEA